MAHSSDTTIIHPGKNVMAIVISQILYFTFP